MLNHLPLLKNLSVRPAQQRDLPFIKRLFRASRLHLRYIDMPSPIIDALVEQQYQLQQAHYRRHWPNHSDWVIEQHSKEAGSLTLEHNPSKLYLLDLAVHPEYQSQKIGTNILKALQGMATANNQTIQLSVDRQNTRAQKLYIALGFRSIQASDTDELMAWESLTVAEPE